MGEIRGTQEDKAKHTYPPDRPHGNGTVFATAGRNHACILHVMMLSNSAITVRFEDISLAVKKTKKKENERLHRERGRQQDSRMPPFDTKTSENIFPVDSIPLRYHPTTITTIIITNAVMPLTSTLHPKWPSDQAASKHFQPSSRERGMRTYPCKLDRRQETIAALDVEENRKHHRPGTAHQLFSLSPTPNAT